ncbi:MAG: hypothetical protein HQ559_14900 [Lentisphaerae bacterium]|nr:hypothetical protein [Lentisphaerota bacterium]
MVSEKTQVTRKKTLVLKSSKKARVKVSAPAGKETVPATDAPAVTPAEGPAAAVAPVAATAKPASYTVAIICALVAIFLFLILLLLQFSEFNSLKVSFPV